MKPKFFPTPSELRAWLAENHALASELLVGFYKKGSGKPSVTWPESVDEALCFGWIDGVRRSLGAEAYSIRFTPRKATSFWSAINVARIAELDRLGRLAPAGRQAFAARTPGRTGVYSYERSAPPELSVEEEQRLRANAAAAAWFDAQAPWYRRTALHWVTSAKRPETRERRLLELIRDSAEGRTIKLLTRPGSTEAATPKAARIATPKAATSKAATSKAATPKAATPKAATPKAATPKAATPKAATPPGPGQKAASGEGTAKAPRERPAPRAAKSKAATGEQRDPPSPAAARPSRPRARRTALGNRVARRPPD